MLEFKRKSPIPIINTSKGSILDIIPPIKVHIYHPILDIYIDGEDDMSFSSTVPGGVLNDRPCITLDFPK